jgi:hypothetical protein
MEFDGLEIPQHFLKPIVYPSVPSHDIYFFDDLELLPQIWRTTNRDNVGELLLSFFQYFARDFRFSFDVISLRTEGGLLTKEQKGWMNDVRTRFSSRPGFFPHLTTCGQRQPEGESHAPWDLNRLCIEVN